MQRAQQQCIELAWQAVDLMFRSGGTSSATKSAMLGRYFRNLAVIRTHAILQPDQTKLLISLNFSRTKVPDLLSRGLTIFTNIGATPGLFTSPPVPLPTLKQELDDLTVFAAAALDGGKKDIAQRDKARKALEHDLSLLAAYVLKVADGDPAIVTASGFVPAPPRTRSVAQPLAQPTVDSVKQGNSGQLLVSVTPIAKAHGYDVRHAPLVNGVPAGNWTTVTVTAAQKPIPIDGLTPGTIYAFQARALGKLGYTDWSDSATRMVI